MFSRVYQRLKRSHLIPRVTGIYEVARDYTNFYQNDASGDRDANGQWKWIDDFMQMPRPSPAVIFDVGGFDGEYSNRILKSRPDTNLHIFEPNPKSLDLLRKNVHGKNVCMVQAALSDEEGTMQLHTNSKTGATDSLIQRKVGPHAHDNGILVPVTTVDKYAKDNDIRYLDLLKVDTEGNDLAVMKGAQEMLASHRIGALNFEFGLFNTFAHNYMLDFTDYLGQFGYSVSKIMPWGIEPVTDPLRERTQHAYFVALL